MGYWSSIPPFVFGRRSFFRRLLYGDEISDEIQCQNTSSRAFSADAGPLSNQKATGLNAWWEQKVRDFGKRTL